MSTYRTTIDGDSAEIEASSFEDAWSAAEERAREYFDAFETEPSALVSFCVSGDGQRRCESILCEREEEEEE